MKIIWAQEAESDLDNIFSFISEKDLDAAIKMDRMFREKAQDLAKFPNLGHIGFVEGTREYEVHKHYKLVYAVRDDCVEIITILHTSRNYPWNRH